MASRYGVSCLAEYPFVVVRVACDLCSRRRGSYRLARLAEKSGAHTPIEDVLERIAFDCPYPPPHKARGSQYVPKCHAYFPDLQRPTPPDLPPGMMRPRLIQGGETWGLTSEDSLKAAGRATQRPDKNAEALKDGYGARTKFPARWRSSRFFICVHLKKHLSRYFMILDKTYPVQRESLIATGAHQHTETTQRKRGRPAGSSALNHQDETTMAEVADIVLSEPTLPPTTAMRRAEIVNENDRRACAGNGLSMVPGIWRGLGSARPIVRGLSLPQQAATCRTLRWETTI